MPRFAHMLTRGMIQRGHQVQLWMPEPGYQKLPGPDVIKKWFGYIDQFIVFPKDVKRRIDAMPADTLYVFSDHSLGPWVPLVAHHSHVIHCHDFMAQLSALGEIEENLTSWTGKKYQAMIRNGFRHGKNFISVSKKTKGDLHRFLGSEPIISAVVHNGLNRSFAPKPIDEAKSLLHKSTGIDLSNGFLIHIGGNQWYKNRTGVVMIYNAWRSISKSKLPLLLIGAEPDESLRNQWTKSSFKNEIHVLTEISDQLVNNAYASATALIFPSLSEGFGWPIAEAMASGCPVLTTNEAPMTEVAGDAGFMIDRQPSDPTEYSKWAQQCAVELENIVSMEPAMRKQITEKCIENARRFDQDLALDKIEKIYLEVLQNGSIR